VGAEILLFNGVFGCSVYMSWRISAITLNWSEKMIGITFGGWILLLDAEVYGDVSLFISRIALEASLIVIRAIF
jgi:hypothetical protein